MNFFFFLGANWMGYCPNYSVRGENSSELGYCIFRSSRKATGGFEIFFFFCARQNWTGGVGVATSFWWLGQKSPRSRHEIHVVTWGKRCEVAT